MSQPINRRAIEILADARIREAQEQGLFEDIDEPYDALWWIKRWIRREGLREAIREGRQDERVRKLETLYNLRP